MTRFAQHVRVLGIAFALVFSLASSGAVHATDWGYDLGAELMSPYCPGRTLSSCPSPQAAELVQWIVTQEAAGTSREEVLAMLVERFGEEILGAPPAKGITLWAYVFPVVGFVAFGGIALIVLRRIVGKREPLPIAAPGAPLAAGHANMTGNSTGTTTGSAIGNTSLADADLARRVDAELANRG